MKKKMLAIVMAGVMTIGFGATAMAADAAIDTTKDQTTQEGSIWGSVSATPLKQMKATVPIKIDFALMQDSTIGNPNKMVVSDQYAIKVPADSQVGVVLKDINVTSVGGAWKLATQVDATAETTDVKKINLNVGGVALKEGTNTIANFKVGINAEKKLGITGQGSKAAITDAVTEEKAFTIVYTIAQDN